MMTDWEMYIIWALCFCFFTMWAIFIYDSFGNIFGYRKDKGVKAPLEEIRELRLKREHYMNIMRWLCVELEKVPKDEAKARKNKQEFIKARDELRKISDRMQKIYEEICNDLRRPNND